MKIFRNIIFAVAAVSLASCSDWTKPESVGINSPAPGDRYQEEYGQYLENIRAYKAGDHRLAIGWLDNSASVPGSQADRLSALPDSLDAVVLMYPEMLDEWEIREMHQVQSDKGTKVLYQIDYASVLAGYEAEQDDESGQEIGQEADGFPAYLSSYLDRVLPLCVEYGFDGISLWYDPEDVSHLPEADKAVEEARQTVMESRISEWIAASPDKLFILECNEPRHIADKSILENADYIAVHTEELENILSVELEVRSAAAGDVPSDRFIVTASATSSSDPALGWIMDAEGNKVEAVTETAWWIAEPETDIVKAGIGICNIRNDYFGSTLNYALTRKAISIISNTSNN